MNRMVRWILIVAGALLLLPAFAFCGFSAYCVAFNFLHRNDSGSLFQSMGLEIERPWWVFVLTLLAGLGLIVLGLRISPRRA